jgi:hypothetical protein
LRFGCASGAPSSQNVSKVVGHSGPSSSGRRQLAQPDFARDSNTAFVSQSERSWRAHASVASPRDSRVEVALSACARPNSASQRPHRICRSRCRPGIPCRHHPCPSRLCLGPSQCRGRARRGRDLRRQMVRPCRGWRHPHLGCHRRHQSHPR